MNALGWTQFSANSATWMNASTRRAVFVAPGAASQETTRRSTFSTDRSSYDILEAPHADNQRSLALSYTEGTKQLGVSVVADGTASTDGSRVVQGYHLGWAGDELHYTQLPNSRAFFTTAKMNGCCVFVGGSRQNPFIMHANFTDEIPGPVVGDEAETKRLQLAAYATLYNRLQNALISKGLVSQDEPLSRFDPAFYMNTQYGGGRGTVWGVRGVDGWTFYYNMDIVGPVVTTSYLCGLVQVPKKTTHGTPVRRGMAYTGQLWPERQDPEADATVAELLAS
ncbi:MAG TPA: hypothetical protein VE153_21680 [Myxococcus sp.]|jgi:hypothetical protein|nr:hypothetical protein [Myxococcus sp.]